MTDTPKGPERIWAEDEFGEGHEDQWSYGAWDTRNVYGYVVEYVRADIHDAFIARAEAAERQRDEAQRATILSLIADDYLSRLMGQRLCCNGHECGCMGADVQSYLEWLAEPTATTQEPPREPYDETASLTRPRLSEIAP